ncbi:unnamed protein product [Rotaria sordida]|uniref:Cytochrome P450 n=1 Tax=Rotaria sordida TaxID=392033 RepID=A0A819RQA7_9BILA|nr:unnamed protein product [Rotaria sordida]CAF4051647.1 unnamed protein product [Rotaria sordida]
MPSLMAKIYLKFSPQYRQSMNIISKHLNGMMEQERSRGRESIVERKTTSLIASLVYSLQQDEKSEAAKSKDKQKEVLRFGPPVSFTVRNVTTDDRPPIICGAQLYKGDKIDAYLFYPERFQDEDKDYHRYASFPFGGDHRQCIGQDLARLPLKAITARLMQHVTFDDGGPEVNAGGHSWKITLTPKNIGVTITFD